jgi:adenosine deaminase
MAQSGYTTAGQFFSEHSLSNPNRFVVSIKELEFFIQEFHAEQRAQHVVYAELRISPRRFLSHNATLSAVLNAAGLAASALDGPSVRLILLVNRDSSTEFVDSCEAAIIDGIPHQFVGIDLAGDEVQFPDVHRFERCFQAARSAGLGVTVHAGEFGNADNIWRALDRLGATRIGHGVSAIKCQKLARRLSADHVLIESSISSNIALGAVPSLESHPLSWFLENDVPVCLNTDVPLHLGTKLSDEFQFARVLLNDDLHTLEFLETSARRYRFDKGMALTGDMAE